MHSTSWATEKPSGEDSAGFFRPLPTGRPARWRSRRTPAVGIAAASRRRSSGDRLAGLAQLGMGMLPGARRTRGHVRGDGGEDETVALCCEPTERGFELSEKMATKTALDMDVAQPSRRDPAGDGPRPYTSGHLARGGVT